MWHRRQLHCRPKRRGIRRVPEASAYRHHHGQGQLTDATIAQLEEVFEPGDIIVDGGNSFFKDTIKREKGSTCQGLPLRGLRRVRW